jgi:HD-GYP domain-containing protein (c-di-GMP phosphodiesterase class II)
MSGQTLSQDVAAPTRFFPVGLTALDERALAMDLYLKPNGVAEPVLYRAAGRDFSIADRRRLIAQGIEYLYIPVEQHTVYRCHFTERLDRLFRDPEKERAERARAVRDSCSKMIDDVLIFPGQREVIDAVTDISKQFAGWATDDNEQFSYLLDMAAHDFYTVTHMMNVGVGCGLLGKALRPDEPDLLAEIVQGGLLHDVGKRGIPQQILNKEGRLAAEEWEAIKRHPHAGFSELTVRPETPRVVLEMIRDHHERLDGRGYPAGEADDRISFAVRICTVVDVFDAICARRPYRGPTPPLETLEIMRDGVGTQFDPDIFESWSRIVTSLIKKDPGRAVAARANPQRLVLDELLPAEPLACATGPADTTRRTQGRERRCYVRYPCAVAAKVTSLRHESACPIQLGEWAQVRLVNVSQGGACLRVPWPLSIGDVLQVELPIGTNRIVKRMARIMHAKPESESEWLVGVCFVGTR